MASANAKGLRIDSFEQRIEGRTVSSTADRAVIGLSEQQVPSIHAVALLDVDPELARHVASAERDHARETLRVPLVTLTAGAFETADALNVGTNPFAAMVVSGLVAREIAVLGQPTLRLLGPGDLIFRMGIDGDLITPRHSWSAALPTALAILDDQLLHAVRRWPRLVRGLLERGNESHDATLVQLAISQQPRVEDRLIVLFRLLGERWGRMTAAGIAVPMVLTHEALGRLIGARRPTVSLALKALSDSGRLTRERDGAWLLHDVAEMRTDRSAPPLTDGSRPRLLPAVEAAV